MQLHKTRLTLVLAIAFGLVWASYMGIAERQHPHTGHADQFSNPAYAVQPERNHMAIQDGKPTGLTDAEVAQVAANYTYVNLNSNDAAGSWVGQANDARRIIAKNPKAQVFGYYKTSFASPGIHADMGTYGVGFQEGDLTSQTVSKPAQLGWYLRQYVAPQPGVTAGGNVGPPIKFDDSQYFNDLTNPAYQAWMQAAVIAWAKSAPWAGIKFDTSFYLAGNETPSGNMYGSNTTLNDLVCGPGAWDQTGANCPKVAAWNNALSKQFTVMAAALHAIGKQLYFNGITPNQPTVNNRMLTLLSNYGADGAMDESFCVGVSSADTRNASVIKYTNITDDLALMTSGGYAAKRLNFQTNYTDPSKIALAPYCIAGFLMGWQPGQDYYRFGQSYQSSQLSGLPDPSRGFLPHNGTDELDLNLGLPTARYTAHGTVLSRGFQNGFVAVNVGDSVGSVRLPSKVIQFSKGVADQTYNAGSMITLAGRSGAFFLYDSYLRVPPATNTTTTATTKGGSGSGGADQTTGGGSSAAKTNAGIASTSNTRGSPSGQPQPTIATAIARNSGDTGAPLGKVAKDTAAPATITLLGMALIFWFLHHFRLIHIRWLYRKHLAKLEAPIVTMDEPLPVAETPRPIFHSPPGTVITPDHPPDDRPPDRL